MIVQCALLKCYTIIGYSTETVLLIFFFLQTNIIDPAENDFECQCVKELTGFLLVTHSQSPSSKGKIRQFIWNVVGILSDQSLRHVQQFVDIKILSVGWRRPLPLGALTQLSQLAYRSYATDIRPCSDFTDMLRRFIKCRIIIITVTLICVHQRAFQAAVWLVNKTRQNNN